MVLLSYVFTLDEAPIIQITYIYFYVQVNGNCFTFVTFKSTGRIFSASIPVTAGSLTFEGMQKVFDKFREDSACTALLWLQE